jgi:gas vesicle protein
MSGSRGSGSFVFFLVGLGIGAVAGLVLAPRSGEETRRYLVDKGEEGKEYLSGKGKRVRHQAEEFVSKGRGLLGKGRERLAGAVQAGKQTYYATLGRSQDGGNP